MNSQVASYYRTILFGDAQDLQPLPKTLMKFHAWAEKRNHSLGLTTTISKATALAVALAWLSGTTEGRKFALDNLEIGKLFAPDELPAETSEKQDSEPEAGKNPVDWAKIKSGTPVFVTEESGQTVSGTFIGRRGVWVDCTVNGTERHFRLHQVQLA